MSIKLGRAWLTIVETMKLIMSSITVKHILTLISIHVDNFFENIGHKYDFEVGWGGWGGPCLGVGVVQL